MVVNFDMFNCSCVKFWSFFVSNSFPSYLKYSQFDMFQVFSSGRRDSGGGIYRAGSSSLSLLPYFDMADLASSGPYIVSKNLFWFQIFRLYSKFYLVLGDTVSPLVYLYKAQKYHVKK